MTTADAMVASSPEAAIIQTKMDKSMSELHARMPSSEEADGFNARVDEVSMLIDGLSKGTISPEYIDSKLAAKAKKAEQAPKVCPDRGPKLARPRHRVNPVQACKNRFNLVLGWYLCFPLRHALQPPPATTLSSWCSSLSCGLPAGAEYVAGGP